MKQKWRERERENEKERITFTANILGTKPPAFSTVGLLSYDTQSQMILMTPHHLYIIYIYDILYIEKDI